MEVVIHSRAPFAAFVRATDREEAPLFDVSVNDRTPLEIKMKMKMENKEPCSAGGFAYVEIRK
jgi:hypothetical protein